VPLTWITPWIKHGSLDILAQIMSFGEVPGRRSDIRPRSSLATTSGWISMTLTAVKVKDEGIQEDP
jgi:hypothetical protein